MTDEHLWWQKGIVYQIYPRSYQDSNDDGIGDLPGIIQRLDYLKSLNVDAIWLSPIYPSPMADFGYDVADYTGIHPIFGSMDDFDRLLAETHRRDLKLILDLVPNHSSNQHPWFIQSRSSRQNPKRDWYIWRDPAPDGGPPNNWLSFFGGPAWTFDPATGQYYLHQFAPEQPDLNYRNPEVVQAMLDVMRFWLDKGIDGFRVDVIWLLVEDEEFRDEPLNSGWDSGVPHHSLEHIYTQNLPETRAVIRKMRAVVNDYPGRVLIGEIYLPTTELVKYYGEDHDEVHLPFNFQLLLLSWSARLVRQAIETYEKLLPEGGWPNWVLGNHDKHRVASRIGAAQARIANMLLLTLRGTPTTYYGEEIGMENVPIPLEFLHDPPAVNQPEIAHIVGRDPERTPMQWDSSPNAGFTSAGVIPWLPIASNYREHNVAVQDREADSMLSLYRALTSLRRAEPALSIGSYATVETGPDDVLAYLRTAPNADTFLVVLNFGGNACTLNLGQVAPAAHIAISSEMVRSGPVALTRLTLEANEGLVLRLV